MQCLASIGVASNQAPFLNGAWFEATIGVDHEEFKNYVTSRMRLLRALEIENDKKISPLLILDFRA